MKTGRWGTLASLLLATAALGCDDDPTFPADDAAFEVVVSGETFVVEVTGEANVADMEERLASGAEGVIIGPLLDGDGGFNDPWSWHLDADEVHVADAAVEVCDGRPSMVEADLDYWLDTVGSFCPWGAKVTKRIR